MEKSKQAVQLQSGKEERSKVRRIRRCLSFYKQVFSLQMLGVCIKAARQSLLGYSFSGWVCGTEWRQPGELRTSHTAYQQC